MTKCHDLKLPASDGKFYKTETLSTRNFLRLIQSIPSPKAEPFKMWLAQLTNEGGSVAKNARTDIESRTGKTVISKLNANDKPALDVKEQE